MYAMLLSLIDINVSFYKNDIHFFSSPTLRRTNFVENYHLIKLNTVLHEWLLMKERMPWTALWITCLSRPLFTERATCKSNSRNSYSIVTNYDFLFAICNVSKYKI